MNTQAPAIETLRKMVAALDYEREDLLTDLPTVQALVDFRALWTTYGTEFWEGVLECIADGEDPAHAQDLCKKAQSPGPLVAGDRARPVHRWPCLQVGRSLPSVGTRSA